MVLLPCSRSFTLVSPSSNPFNIHSLLGSLNRPHPQYSWDFQEESNLLRVFLTQCSLVGGGLDPVPSGQYPATLVRDHRGFLKADQPQPGPAGLRFAAITERQLKLLRIKRLSGPIGVFCQRAPNPPRFAQPRLISLGMTAV